MGCEAGTKRTLGAIASDFRALASDYRRISACISGVGELCEKEDVQRDQVLDIAFGSVVRRIDEGAGLMEQAAERLSAASDAESAAAAPASVPSIPVPRVPASIDAAPTALRHAADALEATMLRVLDVVEEADREDLVGDSHPFGHLIHGICVPYVLLAADVLDQR